MGSFLENYAASYYAVHSGQRCLYHRRQFFQLRKPNDALYRRYDLRKGIHFIRGGPVMDIFCSCYADNWTGVFTAPAADFQSLCIRERGADRAKE